MLSNSILIIQEKTSGPAGFSGGTPVSVYLIPEGFTANISFTKIIKNQIFFENNKIQPYALFQRTTAGDEIVIGSYIAIPKCIDDFFHPKTMPCSMRIDLLNPGGKLIIFRHFAPARAAGRGFNAARHAADLGPNLDMRVLESLL